MALNPNSYESKNGFEKFLKNIIHMVNSEVILELYIENGYSVDLYKGVCKKEYKRFNSEL